MLLSVSAPHGRARGAAAPSKARPLPSPLRHHATPRAGCRPLLAPSPAPRAAPRRRGSVCIAALPTTKADEVYLPIAYSLHAATAVLGALGVSLLQRGNFAAASNVSAFAFVLAVADLVYSLWYIFRRTLLYLDWRLDRIDQGLKANQDATAELLDEVKALRETLRGP